MKTRTIQQQAREQALAQGHKLSEFYRRFGSKGFEAHCVDCELMVSVNPSTNQLVGLALTHKCEAAKSLPVV